MSSSSFQLNLIRLLPTDEANLLNQLIASSIKQQRHQHQQQQQQLQHYKQQQQQPLHSSSTRIGMMLNNRLIPGDASNLLAAIAFVNILIVLAGLKLKLSAIRATIHNR